MRHTDRIFFTNFLVYLPLIVFYSCNCFANNDKRVDTGLNYSTDSVKIDISRHINSNIYRITDTIDLGGKTLYLPVNSCLDLRSGLIKNGAIVGNNTRLNYKNAGFDRVQIRGSWIVRKIHTRLFKDLSYDNSLKDVFALTNPNIKNHVIIERGKYQVTAPSRGSSCLVLCSKTDVKLLGDLYLTPNNYPMYSIIKTEGDNIRVEGAGTIVGDNSKHIGEEGEWGMGIYINGGKKVELKGITVKDCWGDCIYITRKAKDVLIDGCLLEQSRRQGISIISTHNTVIKRTTINNIKGAFPGYGIDIEPNEGDTVINVKIEGITINGCRGGILSKGQAIGSYIESVNVKDCVINYSDVCPLNFRTTNRVKVINCNIISSTHRQDVILSDVDSATVDRIIINGKKIDIRNDKRVYIESIK